MKRGVLITACAVVGLGAASVVGVQVINKGVAAGEPRDFWVNGAGAPMVTALRRSEYRRRQEQTLIRPGKPFALEVTELDGRRHALTARRGERIVATFGTTDCPPCRAQEPELIRAASSGKVRVISVYLDNKPAKVAAYAGAHPMPFDVVLADSRDAYARLGGLGVPTNVLIDERGNVEKLRFWNFRPGEIDTWLDRKS